VKENNIINFLAKFLKRNIPTPRTKRISPQNAYDRHVLMSLQPLEDGKKNIREMNPIVTTNMAYAFINIFNMLHIITSK